MWNLALWENVHCNLPTATKFECCILVIGYTIPKGWKVFASFRAVHLNPEYYKDARTFNPWRWQVLQSLSLIWDRSQINFRSCHLPVINIYQSNSSEAANPANVYTPFGGGPRLCPGYELARVVLSVFLHRIVTRFRYEHYAC